eukprot:c12199_g1_i1.p1 GENE.c12199_g1_i1~~c12199_g1_i1.p1  ORF type:complete len:298 (-),score=73.35 c12199_g1_i1:222-1115(-)
MGFHPKTKTRGMGAPLQAVLFCLVLAVTRQQDQVTAVSPGPSTSVSSSRPPTPASSSPSPSPMPGSASAGMLRTSKLLISAVLVGVQMAEFDQPRIRNAFLLAVASQANVPPSQITITNKSNFTSTPTIGKVQVDFIVFANETATAQEILVMLSNMSTGGVRIKDVMNKELMQASPSVVIIQVVITSTSQIVATVSCSPSASLIYSDHNHPAQKLTGPTIAITVCVALGVGACVLLAYKILERSDRQLKRRKSSSCIQVASRDNSSRPTPSCLEGRTVIVDLSASPKMKTLELENAT